MFKFLRKYSKWILAVGGTLLMITFLIPQAIQSLSQRAAIGGATWATVGEDEDDVSGAMLARCQSELRIIQSLGLDTAVLGIDLRQNPAHWYLLVREAEKAGLVGGSASDAIPPDQMQLFYARAGQSAMVDQTIGKVLSVQRMLALYQSAPKLSDSRLRTNAERRFHTVEARLAAIPATARPAAPAPSEEELRAHFDKFKDTVPGEGDQGFGYRLPNRFHIEWLTIPYDSVREMVEASGALNNIALFKHWQKNVDKPGFPALDAGGEIPELVRTDLMKELVGVKRQEIEKYVTNKLTESWRRLKTSESYRVVPEGWASARLGFPALAEQLQAGFEGLPLPIYEAVGDRWLTVEDLQEFPDLARASTNRFGQLMRTPALIEATREFGGSEGVLVQEGIAGPPLRTLENGIVFFRITATDPARAPRDVDEVREQLVNDLKRKAHYAELLARVDSIEADLKREGLLAVAMNEDVEVERPAQAALYHPAILNLQLQRNLPLIEQPTELPVVGSDIPTIEVIVDRALALPRDKPLKELPAADRSFVVPVDSAMTILAIELMRQTPLSRETYAQLATRGLTGLVLTDEMLALDEPVVDAFSYETLAARHNFKVRQSEDEDTTTPDTATARAE